MKLLLDSHAFLWFAENDLRLPAKSRRAIEDPSNQKLISVATIWELSIKIGLRKLDTVRPLRDVLQLSFEHGIRVLAITSDDALIACELAYHHRDPFDRMIIAQALNADLVVVTKDKWFDAYGVKRLWSR